MHDTWNRSPVHQVFGGPLGRTMSVPRSRHGGEPAADVVVKEVHEGVGAADVQAGVFGAVVQQAAEMEVGGEPMQVRHRG